MNKAIVVGLSFSPPAKAARKTTDDGKAQTQLAEFTTALNEDNAEMGANDFLFFRSSCATVVGLDGDAEQADRLRRSLEGGKAVLLRSELAELLLPRDAEVV